jgi:hypothetical protein
MAEIVAMRLVEHLERAGIVVMKRPAEFWRRITPSSIYSTNVVLLVEDTCAIPSP